MKVSEKKQFGCVKLSPKIYSKLVIPFLCANALRVAVSQWYLTSTTTINNIQLKTLAVALQQNSQIWKLCINVYLFTLCVEWYRGGLRVAWL